MSKSRKSLIFRLNLHIDISNTSEQDLSEATMWKIYCKKQAIGVSEFVIVSDNGTGK